MNPMKITLEFIGWYGVTAILVAYALVSFGVLGPSSLLAISLNLTGAFGVIACSAAKRAWQPAVLNAIWLVVALMSLARYFWVWGG